MSIKPNVFASKSERRNYYKLSRQWGDSYRIYHNLPFLCVFTTDNLLDFTDPFTPKPLTLTKLEIQHLKKTSIDYTVCDQNDKPIICIEFDGLQQGFSHGIQYHADRGSDVWRRQITELKLKVAHGSLFPFIVVGSDMFRDLDHNIQLTILDGIIGEVISRNLIKEKLSTGSFWDDIGYTKEQFDTLDPSIQQSLIEDYGIDVEVLTQMEHNPIWKASAELSLELREHYTGWSVLSLEYPPIDPKIKGIERIHAFQSAKLVGSKIVLHTKKFGEVAGRIMIPNFKIGALPFSGLTEELAMIQALLNLKKLVQSDSSKNKR